MAVFGEIKTGCLMCDCDISYFGNPKELYIIDKNFILPLCRECSEKVREFIIINTKK